MVKVELAKRTYIDVYIYLFFILVISCFSLITHYYGDGFNNSLMPIIIVVLVVGVPTLVSAIPFKRHKASGRLIADYSQVVFDYKGQPKTLNIAQVDKIRIKLIGFDGQPLFKNMEELSKTHRHDMNRMKLAKGLGNYMHITSGGKKYKIKMYFGHEKEYVDFKNIALHWKETTANTKVKILR